MPSPTSTPIRNQPSRGRAVTEDGGNGFETVFGPGAHSLRRRLGVGAFAAIALLVALGAFIAWRPELRLVADRPA